MSYAALALLTAALFLRPEELFPAIAGARLYLSSAYSVADGCHEMGDPRGRRGSPDTKFRT